MKGEHKMNLKEAYENGYRLADCQYQNGYVSRKCDIDMIEPEKIRVYEAGGKRKGQLYVLRPCFNTSRYCFRQYLTK